jgi:hypothetical protein
MWNWKLLAGIVLCCSVVAASDQLAEKWQKRINDIEATHAAAITKADNARFFATQKANGDRLNGFKKALADANKTTDVHAINALRDKVLAAEKDGVSRPKPKNVVKFGGHEYAVIEGHLSFHFAKQAAEELGGHLVTFESAQEQEFILEFGRQRKLGVWIGLSNEADHEKWTWITGQPCLSPGEYRHDNHDRATNSMAMTYWPDTDSFNDDNMGAHMGFICEWDN